MTRGKDSSNAATSLRGPPALEEAREVLPKSLLKEHGPACPVLSVRERDFELSV